MLALCLESETLEVDFFGKSNEISTLSSTRSLASTSPPPPTTSKDEWLGIEIMHNTNVIENSIRGELKCLGLVITLCDGCSNQETAKLV